VNRILKKHSQEVNVILAKYPPDQKRAAVMPLLHIAQQDDGFISRETMQEIAEITESTVTDVASIIGFYTLFHDKPEGKIRLQVCTDVACDLRGAKEYLLAVRSGLGLDPGEITPDGLVSIEEVKCLAACDRAPMFQAQIGDELEYHENQTAEKTLDWLSSMTASMRSASEKLASRKLAAEQADGGSHE
jgi:NADH-quinone oxidoreductase subunit E